MDGKCDDRDASAHTGDIKKGKLPNKKKTEKRIESRRETSATSIHGGRSCVRAGEKAQCAEKKGEGEGEWCVTPIFGEVSRQGIWRRRMETESRMRKKKEKPTPVCLPTTR